jgi:hypothetical protein
MADEYTIDTLAIKVEDQSSGAGEGLGKLADALGRLKSSVQGSWKGLSALSERLTELKSATDGLSKASENIKALAVGLRELTNVRNANISPTLVDRVQDISAAADFMTGKQAANLRSMAYAVREFSDVNEVKIDSKLPERLLDIASVADMLDGKAVNNFGSLGAALRGMSNIGKINIPKTLPDRLSAIGTAMNSITPEAISNLDQMTASLQRLQNIDLGGISTAIKSASVGGAFTGMGVIDASASEQVEGMSKKISLLRSDLRAIGKTKVKPKVDTSEIKAATKHSSKLKTILMSIGRIAWYRAIRSMLASLTEGFQEVAQQNESANKTLSEIVSSVHYLRDSIIAAILPALQAITPILTTILDALANVFNLIAKIIGLLTGQDTVLQATKQQINYAESLESTASAAKEALKYLLPIDELNIMDGSSGGGTGTGTGGSHYEPATTNLDISGLSNLQDAIAAIPETIDSPKWDPNPIPAPTFETVTLPKEAGKTISSPAWLPNPIPAPVFEKVEYPDEAGATILSPIWSPNPILAPELETVPVLDALKVLEDGFDSAVEKIKKKLDEVSEYTKGWNTSMKPSFGTLADYIATIFNPSLGTLEYVFLQAYGKTLVDSNAWSKGLGTVFKTIAEYIPNVSAMGLTEAANDFVEFVNQTSQSVVNWGNNQLENARKTMSGMVQTIANGLSERWENFKNFWKATGEKVSGWFSANKSWVVPSVVCTLSTLAVGSIIISGGFTAPALGAAALAIPALANGGVLTQPTTVLAGEYPGASSNPEIVAPQKILRETFQEEQRTDEILNAVYAVGSMIVNAINSKDVDFSIDGASITRTIRPYLDKQNKLAGTSLVSG